MQKTFELNLVKLTFVVKNEVGESNDLRLTTCFLTSEKHSFGVHTNKSPQICTHVEQIFLYKAGLLLNIDVAVPFLKKSKKYCLKLCVHSVYTSLSGCVGNADQSDARIYLDWQPTISHSSHSAPVA